jgi:hypothetical protein
MKIKLAGILFLIVLNFNAQNNCQGLTSDTLYIPAKEQVLNGESIQASMKNSSVVKLFRSGEKYFLKLFVTKNFYFNKVDVLEIRSGSKSYYAKESKQYKINKTLGMFVFEIYKNYVATLREEGITSIVFAEAETDFTRQDANEVKKIAKCFYESISGKKQEL